MLARLLRRVLSHAALRHGRLAGLYRRFCRPDGYAWASYLAAHGQLYAIGRGCSIQSNVTFTDPCHVRLGDNVHLSGCTLFGHDGAVIMLKQAHRTHLDRVGRIDIGDNVFVGHQAIIMPNVTIGPNAIVGAGAVVTGDVAPGSVVAGVPARVICSVDDYHARCLRETALLPWREHPAVAADYFGPAPADLSAWRQSHFFPADAGAGGNGAPALAVDQPAPLAPSGART